MHFPSRNTTKNKKPTAAELNLYKGFELIKETPVFGSLPNTVKIVKLKSDSFYAKTESSGVITVNQNAELSANEWAYVIVHCALHHVFGHFDKDNLPDDPHFNKQLWNAACDMFITKYLAELKFGMVLYEIPEGYLPKWTATEKDIYQYLKARSDDTKLIHCGTALEYQMDMEGLDKPIVYIGRQKNQYRETFFRALKWAVNCAVSISQGQTEQTQHKSLAVQASKWFIDHYPLLGGLAASFQIVENHAYCQTHQIQIAAIDISRKEIYVNPAVYLSEQEWRFVLAHEYMHAGLAHISRCGDRDFHLWNIAADFVINGWLYEMGIGSIPSVGVLFDPSLAGLSAESIYDMLIENIRKSKKLATFRGYGQGDMLKPDTEGLPYGTDYTTFDDVCKEALAQGLEYHQLSGRGLLPSGLVEEIRALSMPPVPWDVKLAQWFQEHIAIPEKKRSYARPSRRQGATPDIPRPSYMKPEEWQRTNTFGVVVDTSGSMNVEVLGKALGAIASYAEAREVRYVRVVFCDAAAYDAGYLSVEDLAGRVEVKGRGGTRLQPAVDLLEEAKDFPADGPILLITDGYIEPKVTIHREHAWLIPDGNHLPFRTNNPVFLYK